MRLLGFRIGLVQDIMKLINKEVAHRYCQDLERQQPGILLVGLFSSGTARGNKRDRLAATTLATVLTLQANAGRHIIVDGGKNIHTWFMAELRTATTHKALHQYMVAWCNLGLKEDGQASVRTTRVLSTINASLYPCACGTPPDQHTMTKNRNATDEKTLFDNFYYSLYQKLCGTRPEFKSSKAPVPPVTDAVVETGQKEDAVVALCAEPAKPILTLPDSPTSASNFAHELEVRSFPTEQRKLQQARFKEKGKPAAIRKAQVVEQHFDDCGSDFSALDQYFCYVESTADTVQHAYVHETEITRMTTYWQTGFRGARHHAESLAQLAQQSGHQAIQVCDDITRLYISAVNDWSEAGHHETIEVGSLLHGNEYMASFRVSRTHLDGREWHAVTTIDVNDTHDKEVVGQYLHHCKPGVAVIFVPGAEYDNLPTPRLRRSIRRVSLLGAQLAD